MMADSQFSLGPRPARAQQTATFRGQTIPQIPTGPFLRHKNTPLCLASTQGFNFVLALMLLSSGCSIFSGYSSGPLASVTIFNQPRERIEDATTAVFVLNGYQSGPGGGNQLTFERPGSTSDNVAYGSLFFKRSTTERVTVSLQPREDGATIVSCNAILIEAQGDHIDEETHKVGRNRREPYERMLNSIRARLL